MRRFCVALAGSMLAFSLLASCAQAALSDYGIEAVSASLTSTQAGAHPDFTTTLELKKDASGAPFASTRDIRVDLPPGLVANLASFPRCTTLQLVVEEACPQDAQIGVTEIVLFGLGTFTEPIYNMVPTSRSVVRLGLIAGIFPTLINAEVRSEDRYGATVSVEGAASVYPVMATVTTVWGVPADPSHDSLRITPREAWESTPPPGGTRPSGLVPEPLLRNPTSCGAGRQVSFATDSYAFPGQFSTMAAPLPDFSGCEALGFEPSLAVQPTSAEAGTPTGLDVTLTLPQDESPTGYASSDLRDAKVSFPAGMTIAPGAAAGLSSCDAAEAGYLSRNPSRCPQAAKLGTVEVRTPVLAEPLHGALYQRTPEAGHLFRIWLTIDDQGIHAALPGELEVDPQSGQITTSFSENPEVPISELSLHVFGGARAPLANPPACGTYQTTYEFTPWSGNPSVRGRTPMTIDQGCDVGGFDPKLSAGTTNPNAGQFSPFLFTLTRQDGEQNPAALDITLPQGLAASFKGIARCEGFAAESGACPPESKVGHVIAAVGAGPAPLWVPQPGKRPTAVYLAAPYKGAPLSIVSVVPAQAGPFDLGDQVVRSAIYVDPRTAQATIKSDPLPQIIQGIPVTYRTIHVDVDRPNFTLNPTNCEEMQVGSLLTSDNGATASPASRFQVGGCRELAFKPRLSLRLFGKTNRGAHPRLRAVLKARRGDANIGRAQVALPRSEFLDQGHIRTVCTRVQFAADQCPKGSTYGHVTATTPLLDEPVQGPVYLRSSENLLPDLVAALEGPASLPIEFNAVARVDSVGGAIRASFETLPDVPITKAVLTMQGGKKGLIVNSRDLCAKTSRASARFGAHNGRRRNLRPALQSSCKKARKHKLHKRHRRAHR